MSTNPPDYDALARKYLDLWQQEMAKLAQDPKAAGTWANLFQGMMQNAAAWSPQAATMKTTAPMTGTTDGSPDAASTTAATSETRASAAAAASGNGGLALADVLRRIDGKLDGIEQRLTALEQAAAAATPRRRTKPAKS